MKQSLAKSNVAHTHTHHIAYRGEIQALHDKHVFFPEMLSKQLTQKKTQHKTYNRDLTLQKTNIKWQPRPRQGGYE